MDCETVTKAGSCYSEFDDRLLGDSQLIARGSPSLNHLLKGLCSFSFVNMDKRIYYMLHSKKLPLNCSHRQEEQRHQEPVC